VTLNDLEVELHNCRYIALFQVGKPAFQHITASARKKESSHSLSYLLMKLL